jgi:probable HAF family extracellular repeat protein
MPMARLPLKRPFEEKQSMRQEIQYIGILTLIVCLLLFAPSAQAQFKFRGYTLVDLGVSDWAVGQSINNSGRVVGNMGVHAFRTSSNQPIVPATEDIGVLPMHQRSFAHAINNDGVVVGDSARDSPYEWRAFRFGNNGAGMENLHALGIHSGARGINDHGWIVGYFTTSGYVNQAMISFGPGWTFSLESALGNPSQSEAHDVNNIDQFVGWLSTPTSMPQAFFFDASGGGSGLLRLGILPGGTSSKAYGVNDVGQVVGEADQNGWYHAFLWKDLNNNRVSDPGEMRDLAPNYPCSRATGINNGGTAVGYYCSNSPSTYGQSRAFLVHANGSLVDLNTQILPGSGWILREAYGINDNGQIVGRMQDASGRMHAFRLDPPPPRIIFP